MRARQQVFLCLVAAAFSYVASQRSAGDRTMVGDIVFLIDVSADDFQWTRTFLQTFINKLNISPQEVQIGLVLSGRDIFEEFPLNRHTDRKSLLASVQRMGNQRGRTQTRRALDIQRTRSFSMQAGSRAKWRVPQIAVVVTDGRYDNEVEAAARALRQQGVLVFVTGVGNQVDQEQLKTIANWPPEKFLLTTDSYEDLLRKTDEVLESVCDTMEQQQRALADQFADMFFLVDSGLPPAQFAQFKRNLVQMIDQNNIGVSGYRLGLAQYAQNVRVEFQLNTHQTKQKVLAAAQQFRLRPKPNQSRNLGSALRYAEKHFFSQQAGGRAAEGTPQSLVVVSDEDSDDLTGRAANDLRETGVTLVAIMGRSLGPQGIQGLPGHMGPAGSPGEGGESVPTVSLMNKVLKEQEVEGVTVDCKGANVADIVFIVDESSSMGAANFQLVQNFLHNIISGLVIGRAKVQVGVVSISNTPTAQVDLNTFSDRTELLQYIKLLPYRGGRTNIGAALNFTLSTIFTQRKGSREDVQKVVVVVTDGNSDDSVSEAAQAVRRAGISLYSVGIKDTTRAELEEIASHPTYRHVFDVDSFTKLRPLREVLQKNLCINILHNAITVAESKKLSKEECDQTDEVDIFFLIDVSNSVRNQDLYDMKEFMVQTIRTFRISPTHVRMGLVKYSGSPTLEFNLNTHSDADAMEQAVMTLTHKGGSTATGKALNFVVPHFQKAKISRGYDVRKYLILITGGNSIDDIRVAAARLKAENVTVYAVGGKGVDKAQLDQISGDPKRRFTVKDFKELKSANNDIIEQICSEDCDIQPSDLIFLTDSSESITEEPYKKMKDFIKSVVSRSNVSMELVHVGLMQFSEDQQLEFNLTKFFSLAEILRAIETMKNMESGTWTGKALTAIAPYFTAAKGGRPHLKQRLVVITDGVSNKRDPVKVPAAALRASNVEIYSIGVMDANTTELLEISGSTSRVFNLGNFDALKELVSRLARKFCEPPQACKIHRSDIIFLLDGSSSMTSSEFDAVKAFMESMVKLTTVGEELNRFGVIVFSQTAESTFHLRESKSKGLVQQSIRGLVPARQRTNTALALRSALQSFEPDQGGRKRRRVLVVISDEESTNAAALRPVSNDLKTNNVAVFAVGLQNARQAVLEVMTDGEASRVVRVENAKQLEAAHKTLYPILCNTYKPACNRTDLVFLLDSSSSISSFDYQRMLNFTGDVASSFPVGEKTVRVGLAQFSNDPHKEFYLREYYNREEVLRHISLLRHHGGEAYIGKALDLMKRFFTKAEGSRPGHPRSLVLVTRGESRDEVAEHAKYLRQLGIKIFVISVGITYDMQLLQIAGEPDNLFMVHNFDSLSTIKNDLVNGVCTFREPPGTNCTIDVAIGFDITDPRRAAADLQESMLDKIFQLLSSVDTLCCEGPEPTQTNIAFHLMDRQGRSVFSTTFEAYNVDVLREVMVQMQTQATYFNSAFLNFYNNLFRTRSSTRVKVLLVFSDGLNEDVMTLEKEADLLKASGVSALVTVALSGTDPTELQMVEFGRGFINKVPLQISTPKLHSLLLQQISVAANRDCCGVRCQCFGEEGGRGSPGDPGLKGEHGRPGEPGFPGDEGPQGPPGLPGPDGPKGIQNCRAHRGHKGSRGVAGDRGDHGDPGLDGVTGEQGTTGKDGVGGERGHSGDPGIPGIAGEPGLKGDRGLRGDPGQPGAKNPTSGPKGESGHEGMPGPPGPDGKPGQRGADGYLGLDGRRGVIGDKGAPGQPGAQGLQGIPGASGPQGPRGNKGEQGPKGLTGFPGREGVPGPDGDQGQPGNRGSNGLKGQPGDLGVKGVTGPLGPRGLPGLDGRDGSGTAGPNGLKGDSGFPGYPGLTGEEGQKGSEGYPGKDGLQGQSGFPGDNGPPGEDGDPGRPGHRGPKGPPGATEICPVIASIRDNCECCKGESQCPAHPTELVFGLDMSSDVTEEAFKRQRSALLNLLAGVDISESNCPNGARVAVVGYSSNTTILIRFQDYKQRRQLIAAVENLVLAKPTNKRHLGAAMRFVGHHLFKRVRAGGMARKVAVFFSNGPSQQVDDIVTAVMEYRGLNIVPAVVALGRAPAVARAMEVDDSGTSIMVVLGREEDQDQELRPVKNCAICYDPCRRTEECAFIQEPPKPQDVGLDLVLVLDGSREVRADQYAGAQQLLASVVEQLAVSDEPSRPGAHPRVAAVQQSGGRNAKVEFELKTYKNQELMRRHLLQSMQQHGGASALGLTVELALRDVLLKGAGPRRKKGLLVVVGASSTGPVDQARLRHVSRKSKCDGVAVFVVTVGDRYNRTQVEELAGVPVQQHLIHLSRLQAEEQRYGQRFFRAFLSGLHKGLNVYPPADLRLACSQPTGQDHSLLFTDGLGSADGETVADEAPVSMATDMRQLDIITMATQGDVQKRDKVKDFCLLQKEVGTCQNFTIMWFFDSKVRRCSRFWYGGCKGNQNRFRTQEECRRTCATWTRAGAEEEELRRRSSGGGFAEKTLRRS